MPPETTPLREEISAGTVPNRSVCGYGLFIDVSNGIIAGSETWIRSHILVDSIDTFMSVYCRGIVERTPPMKILSPVFAVVSVAIAIAIAIATAGCTLQAALPHAPDSRGLSIAQLVDIRHPSSPIWAPDGRHVVFVSERAGIANLRVADTDGNDTPARPLTNYEDGQVDGVFWSRDAKTVYFSRRGDLWQVPVVGGEPKPVSSTPAAGTGTTPSPD